MAEEDIIRGLLSNPSQSAVGQPLMHQSIKYKYDIGYNTKLTAHIYRLFLKLCQDKNLFFM